MDLKCCNLGRQDIHSSMSGAKKQAVCIVMQSVAFIELHIVMNCLHICIHILVFLGLKLSMSILEIF